jgi:hypothetical protein
LCAAVGAVCEEGDGDGEVKGRMVMTG